VPKKNPAVPSSSSASPARPRTHHDSTSPEQAVGATGGHKGGRGPYLRRHCRGLSRLAELEVEERVSDHRWQSDTLAGDRDPAELSAASAQELLSPFCARNPDAAQRYQERSSSSSLPLAVCRLQPAAVVSLRRPHLPVAWVCLAARESAVVGEEEAWHGVVPGAERRQESLVRSNYNPVTIFPLLRDVAGCHGKKKTTLSWNLGQYSEE
ncbi:unnamed protein product, partial [Urochloa humidicola]